jgi:hypothetical protein
LLAVAVAAGRLSQEMLALAAVLVATAQQIL